MGPNGSFVIGREVGGLEPRVILCEGFCGFDRKWVGLKSIIFAMIYFIN